MKRLLSSIVALAMLLSVVCFATEENTEVQTPVMVALGDSIASGYSLPDYDESIDRPRSQLSAPVLLANEIGYDLVDLTMEGSMTYTLLYNTLADEYWEYVIDPETGNYVWDEATGWWKMTLVDNRANVEKVKNADLVTISVGNMDLASFYNIQTQIMEKLMNGELTSIDDVTALIEDIVGNIDEMTTQSAENLQLVFDRIYELNPDATIAFQNLYNAYEQVDVTLLKEAIRAITLTLNAKTMAKCLENDVIFVDVYSKLYAHRDEDLIIQDCDSLMDYISGNYESDPHLTALGHEYVAEAYLMMLELHNALPQYTGNSLPSMLKWTKFKFFNAKLPNQVTLYSTHGDFTVDVEEWILDENYNPNALKDMTFIATAVLDLDDVPEFIKRDIGTVGLCIKIGRGSPIKRGDANGDGKVDKADLALVSEHILNDTPVMIDNVDIIKDGKVNALDLVFVTLAMLKK